MNIVRCITVLAALNASAAFAVYAPIPRVEQGKDFSASVRVGISHDSNIFGAATGAINSQVVSVEPTLRFHRSVADQTFFSASYRLTHDSFSDRPGDKSLDSHDFYTRLAHSFSTVTTIELADKYEISRNPESTLAGIPVNVDQSFKLNQFDSRFLTVFGEKTGLRLKLRSMYYDYDNTMLGNELDRTEYLYGLAVSHDLLPEAKMVVEFRRQDVNYRVAGAFKDKQSNFLIGGIDYELTRKFTGSCRLGYEWRSRDGASDTSTPYVEISGMINYAEKSYITAGYVHTYEESSEIARYTDVRVNRIFVNLQQAMSALIVGSASVTYEPATLYGRAGFVDVGEDTTRLGLAISYLFNNNWTFSLTFDNDRVNSDDPTRDLRRQRYGLHAAFSF